MSHENLICRYEHSAEFLKSDTFEAILLEEDQQAIQAGIRSLNLVADTLKKLKQDTQAFFNNKPVADQELVRFYHLSNEELEAELKKGYIISNEIKIQGVDVKLDKLTEIINIPDFTHILETFDELKTSMKFLNSIPGFSINLSQFLTEEGVSVPGEKIDLIGAVHKKQTKNIYENRIYLAGRKILEGFADLEDMGIKCSKGENFYDFANRMLRLLVENKSGKIDVSQKMYRLINNLTLEGKI